MGGQPHLLPILNTPGLLAARAGNGMGRRFRANEVFVTTAMIARCAAWARFRPSLPRAHVWHFLLMDSTPRAHYTCYKQGLDLRYLRQGHLERGGILVWKKLM